MPCAPVASAATPFTISPALPLARWADRILEMLFLASDGTAFEGLSGNSILGLRGTLNQFTVPSLTSAGGGCKLYSTADSWLALNLSRSDDQELLPALLGDSNLIPYQDDILLSALQAHSNDTLIPTGRILGLALAGLHEAKAAQALSFLSPPYISQPQSKKPLVVDLTALWAGPLAGHLLWLSGAEVIKVESAYRPDAMRTGDPALFHQLNQGKQSASCDLRNLQERAALIALLEKADIILEASRPTALLARGIDAHALLQKKPELIWITITGHGGREPYSHYVGFGDDCGVAGGLSAALQHITGQVSFVGDAIGDPLTGLAAALLALRCWNKGLGGRIGISMRGIVENALNFEQTINHHSFVQDMENWAHLCGKPFPQTTIPALKAPLFNYGMQTAKWLRR